jgi:hypothetical protein
VIAAHYKEMVEGGGVGVVGVVGVSALVGCRAGRLGALAYVWIEGFAPGPMRRPPFTPRVVMASRAPFSPHSPQLFFVEAFSWGSFIGAPWSSAHPAAPCCAPPALLSVRPGVASVGGGGIPWEPVEQDEGKRSYVQGAGEWAGWLAVVVFFGGRGGFSD